MIKQLNLIRSLNLQKVERPMIYTVSFIILILLNLVVSTISGRLDFSNGQAYSLSSSTKKIVRNLDDVVTIKLYVSSDLPTQLQPVKTQVTDLLNEYQKVGGKHIVVKVLDTKKDPKIATEAQQAGLPELQFSQLEQNKYAVSASYFGVVLSYVNKTEIIPQVTDLSSLEYNLTAAIYKMTNKDTIKVGVVSKTFTGPVLGATQTNPMANVTRILSQQMDIEPLSISTESGMTQIDSSYKALLVFGDQPYSSDQLTIIDNYLSKGGRVIVFVDGVKVNDDLSTAPGDPSLLPLIRKYGISVDSDLVLSSSAELVNFGNDLMSFMSPYPFWLKTNVFNPKVTYFSNINQLTFPWASSLTLNNAATDLIKTVPQSWIQKDTYVLNPQAIPQPKQTDLKPYIMTAESKNTNGGKIMVIGTTRFIQDRYLTRDGGNLGFILNVINDYASGGALSGIRSREVNFYPIPQVEEGQKDLFKYANILVLPLLLALYGAYRIIKRK